MRIGRRWLKILKMDENQYHRKECQLVRVSFKSTFRHWEALYRLTIQREPHPGETWEISEVPSSEDERPFE